MSYGRRESPFNSIATPPIKSAKVPDKGGECYCINVSEKDPLGSVYYVLENALALAASFLYLAMVTRHI